MGFYSLTLPPWVFHCKIRLLLILQIKSLADPFTEKYFLPHCWRQRTGAEEGAVTFLEISLPADTYMEDTRIHSIVFVFCIKKFTFCG